MTPRMCRWLFGVLLASVAPTAAGQATHVDREGFPLPQEAVARVGSARLRHLGIIHAVAYSRDGKQIISIGADDRICVWDAENGRLLRSCEAKLGTRFPLAVRIADTTVDVATNDFLFSFDAHAGKLVRKVAVNGLGYAQEGWFSPDGAWLASGSSVLDVGRAATGKPGAYHVLGTYPASECRGFTADGKRVVVYRAQPKPFIELIDPATNKGERHPELPATTRCWFAPDGRCLTAEGVWDAVTGKRLTTLALEKNHMQFGSVAFSPDSRHVAIPNSYDIGLYETATGKELRRLPAGPDAVFRPHVPTVGSIRRPLAFAPDGKRLVVGNHEGQISQWDVATGRPLSSADPFTGSIRVCRCIDRDHVLVEADGLALYDCKTGTSVRRFPWEPDPRELGRIRHFANAFASRVTVIGQLSADGTLLAVPGKSGIELRDARNGNLVRKLNDQSGMPAVLAFAPDGKRLYSSDFGQPTIRVWDLAQGKLVRTIAGRAGQYAGSHAQIALEHIAVSTESRWFATAGSDCDSTGKHWLRVWDAGGEPVYQHGFTRALSRHCTFAPTGELLAVLAGPDDRKEHSLTLIDPQTSTRRWNVSLSYATRRAVGSVAFSADGQNLAVGDSDGWVLLYEAATGKIRHVFHGHVRPVDGLAFTPDGALLAASSADAPVLLWDVYGKHERDRKLPSWTAADAPGLWSKLADANAEQAFMVVRRLVHHPEATVALLRAHLLPRVQEQGKQFAKLLQALDSDDFETRQQAQADLKRRADEFELFLSRARVRDYPLEVQRRLEPILGKTNPANPERLRRLRAMEALRQIATPEARRLLEALAASGAAAGKKQ